MVRGRRFSLQPIHSSGHSSRGRWCQRARFGARLALGWDRIARRWPSDVQRASSSNRWPCRVMFESCEYSRSAGSVGRSHPHRAWQVHEPVRYQLSATAWIVAGGLALIAGHNPRQEEWSGKGAASDSSVRQESAFHRLRRRGAARETLERPCRAAVVAKFRRNTTVDVRPADPRSHVDASPKMRIGNKWEAEPNTPPRGQKAMLPSASPAVRQFVRPSRSARVRFCMLVLPTGGEPVGRLHASSVRPRAI